MKNYWLDEKIYYFSKKSILVLEKDILDLVSVYRNYFYIKNFSDKNLYINFGMIPELTTKVCPEEIYYLTNFESNITITGKIGQKFLIFEDYMEI